MRAVEVQVLCRSLGSKEWWTHESYLHLGLGKSGEGCGRRNKSGGSSARIQRHPPTTDQREEGETDGKVDKSSSSVSLGQF